MPEILVGRWVNEEGRNTRKWYWEVRYGGKVCSAGIATARDAAWQHGVESLALAAYQCGVADALGEDWETGRSAESVA